MVREKIFYLSRQFDRADLEYIFGVAHEMRGMVERIGTFDLLKGQNSGESLLRTLHAHRILFYGSDAANSGERSFRLNEVKYSSVSKGESFAGNRPAH